MHYVSADDPPTLIFHGTVDTTVPIVQSDRLDAALKAKGVPVEYHKLPGWPHTMDMAKPVNDYCVACMKEFLAKYAPLPK